MSSDGVGGGKLNCNWTVKGDSSLFPDFRNRRRRRRPREWIIGVSGHISMQMNRSLNFRASEYWGRKKEKERGKRFPYTHTFTHLHTLTHTLTHSATSSSTRCLFPFPFYLPAIIHFLRAHFRPNLNRMAAQFRQLWNVINASVFHLSSLIKIQQILQVSSYATCKIQVEISVISISF